MKKDKDKVNKKLQKVLVVMILSIFCLWIACIECCAEDGKTENKVEENVDGILKDFEKNLPEEYSGSVDIKEVSESVGIKRILENVLISIKENGGEISRFLLTLLGVGLIGTLASLIGNEMGATSSRAVAVVTSAMLFERLLFLIRGAVESLNEIGNFFGAVIPITLAVNSLGVSPTTATAQALGMGITLSAYSYISQSLILPIVSAIFVTSAASSIDPIFGRISSGVKSVFMWIIGIFTALVGATFSLQSVISKNADSAVIRSAKYAISGTIPIVGSAVSGALGLISGGASYARGVVGGGAVAVIITLVLSPLVTLLLYRLSLKAGIFFFSVSSIDSGAGVLTSFLGAFDALIATYALTSIVYIVELVAFLKGGVSLG